MSKIILKNIGRNKVNKSLNVTDLTKRTLDDFMNSEATSDEERLAEIALVAAKKYLVSSNVWLKPDDEKGYGFWKVYVGFGAHVGDIESIL